MIKSQIMTTTLEVIYEDGIFKPLSSVPKTFKEHERMKITIETEIAENISVSPELLREMLAEGMISRIPEGITDEEDDFEPIKIEGKPLSESILEDRN
jgi:predicted DNA-binding antitoxin AbrB/MazE fold protein